MQIIKVNLVCHTKLNHVTMDLHFVREINEQVKLEVKHIPTSIQKADILT